MIWVKIERRSEETSLKLNSSLQQLLKLLSDIQLSNDRTVTLDVCLLEVVEKVSSVTYHLKKTAAAVVIFVVNLEVLVERVDSVCENRDLYLGRTCVTLVGGISFNNCLLFCLKHSFFTFLFIYLSQTQQSVGENAI